MASIKPIESTSVHRIQSGQVIVDLCSVVKELVENSLDAGATSIEVRLKNNGLDAIEVADNGSGIEREDYESVALKHHTSKLRNYDDLSILETFGFRGEALSSLCALANVHIVTAQDREAPKATRLDFEQSGALRETSTQAAQRGTTVYVETIFKNLPVRRQELSKNIKREYGKVLGLLQAYACISTKARITVSNVAAKGKKTIQFATKAGQTTRENIANVYGTKTTAVLIPLDLQLDMQPTTASASQRNTQVQIVGHVSRPTVGEGRSTPDRQMFFVNGRPCALPQVAKAVNEVYKSYNFSQSPFVFADVRLDTNAYDVNISPDKRTIMLHEQGELLNSLREALTELFDRQQQSVPQAKSTISLNKLPAFGPLKPEPQNLAHANEAVAKHHDYAKETEEDAKARSDHVTASPSASSPAVTVPEREGRGDLVQRLFTHKVQDRATSAFKNPQVEGMPAQISNSRCRSDSRQSPLVDDIIQTEAEQTSVIADVPLFVGDGPRDSEALSTDHSGSLGPRKTQTSRTDKDNDGQYPPNEAVSQRVVTSIGEYPEETTSASLVQRYQPQTSPVEEPILFSRPTAAASSPGAVPNAFDRMRPLRTSVRQATITIGDQTTTTTIGSSQKQWTLQADPAKSKVRVTPKTATEPRFQSSLRTFAAPGSQMQREADDGAEDNQGGLMSTFLGHKTLKGQTKFYEIPKDESLRSGSEANVSDVESAEDQQTDRQAEYITDDDSDEEYLDDTAKKEREDARVAKLIQDAQERAARPSEEGIKRAGRLLKAGHRAATTKLLLTVFESTEEILKHIFSLATNEADQPWPRPDAVATDLEEAATAEERLALTVSKGDFHRMRVTGQFNLGFVIAVRPALVTSRRVELPRLQDELFIIDQHASDEKYNFERLQASTTVQNQPLVHRQKLDLTAVEEEIIIENQDILQKNGFEVRIDESGEEPVGKRCTLTRLPMSKEVTFSIRDLEELIALLAESPAVQTQAAAASQGSLSLTAPNNQASSFLTPVVRPSAVRKMFAMRACRSSVMIGKTLSHKQMQGLVTNMGQMEKPWNCPHGRPTMRHLYSFGQWNEWKEGEGVSGMIDDENFLVSKDAAPTEVNWNDWLGSGSSQDDATTASSPEEEGHGE